MPHFNPSQTGRYSIYLPQRHLRLSCGDAVLDNSRIESNRLSTYAVFLVVVDEGERQRDVKWFVLERVSGTFARLKRHHQIDPACRSLCLEYFDEIFAENSDQQTLKLCVHLYSTSEHKEVTSGHMQKKTFKLVQ